MTYIQRELERIDRALDGAVGDPRFAEIYAASHALHWSLDPETFGAPSDYLASIPLGSPDCSEADRPLELSGNAGPCRRVA